MNDPAPGVVRMIPLGGLGNIGRNMMVYETAEDMVVADAGLMFPTDEMHGVDYIIPDASYLEARRGKLRAYLITHGHEDHIGALRFLLPSLPAPIYGAPLTQGLIKAKLDEAGQLDVAQASINAEHRYDFGDISVEFFPVAHSIPDAFGIALDTPAGLIVHTGDFKIDHTPVLSEPTDLGRLAFYGDEGVRLLCSDSTYADRPGSTPTETIVGDTLAQILLTAPGRVIVATFASQIARVQQIFDGAAAADRVVFPTGYSMEKNIRVATDLKYLQYDERRVRDISDRGSVRDERSVILCTGAQGEPMSALSRMAAGNHRDVGLQDGDTVVLSSSPIPGNEAAVNTTIDNLYRAGCNVLYVGAPGCEHVHVRGHAAQEELKTVIGLTRPQAFVPIHGEYRHLSQHARLAQDMGVHPDACHIMLDGQVLELDRERSEVIDQVQSHYIYVDGMNVGGVDKAVIRDRAHLARDGAVIVVFPFDHSTGRLVGEIDVHARGFAELTPELRDGAVAVVRKALRKHSGPVELHEVENQVAKTISRFLSSETKQRPMVIPVAVEV